MSAQGVGWALKALGSVRKKSDAKDKANNNVYTKDSVPWQRVVNASGGTSTHKVGDMPPDLQRRMLEAEGIVFDDDGKMDLSVYLWVEGVRSN